MLQSGFGGVGVLQSGFGGVGVCSGIGRGRFCGPAAATADDVDRTVLQFLLSSMFGRQYDRRELSFLCPVTDIISLDSRPASER